jgi:hypothetical protein
MKNKKGNSKVIALVAVILVASAAIIGWFYSRQIEEEAISKDEPIAVNSSIQNQNTDKSTSIVEKPEEKSAALSKEIQVKANSDICKSYSNILKKYGNIKYDTLNSEGIILGSKGTVCSMAVEKGTFSPNEEKELDTVFSALSKDGWKEDLSMKRDIGGVGSYISTYGYKKADSIIVLQFSASSPQAEVNKCMEITDSHLSITCFNKILKTEKINIMAGDQQQ